NIMSEPAVRVSGIVLASLMFQHANSDSDVVSRTSEPGRFRPGAEFGSGRKLANTSEEVGLERASFGISEGVRRGNGLGCWQDGVIGWYRQRRNSEQQMSFREKVVHENLRRALANPHMIFMLLTPSRAVLTGSTHRTEYAAFICRDRRFVNIPVLVNNLGLLEQQGYWRGSSLTEPWFWSRSKFFCSSGLLREVSEVNSMNESLQAELQKACGCVEESERQLEALQTEVSALRRRLEEKQPPEPGEVQIDAVQAEPRNNGALLSAVRALLGCSPMFLTQTLTLQAFPVPEEDASPETQVKEEQPPLPQLSDMTSRKRPRETAARERKRKCWTKLFPVPAHGCFELDPPERSFRRFS
uniref:Abraxas 1, BRCA1 A complex subunit n=1 Tax=Oryzias melastigma TaxID=30732 RepID=A0A3B3D2W2_ORYME